MAATLDSVAVFTSRCEQLGLDVNRLKAIQDENVCTYSKFAYSCAYQPYSSDETPFLTMLDKLFNGLPDLGTVSILRRIFCEAHALCLQDMRSRCERTDDAAPQKLLAPERSSRYEDQRKRLAGIDLVGAFECSNSLEDAVFQQYEDNSLKWIPLENLTSREQELAGQKKIPEIVEYLTKIQQGRMVVQERRQELPADLSSDLRIRQAWTRRSLAYDQAHLITFLVLERWTAKLIARMYEVPPHNYRRVTLEQCLNADQKLWSKISETCRASIQPFSLNGAEVKPIDQAISHWSDHPDILYLIQPLPLFSHDSETDQFGGEETRSKKLKLAKNQMGNVAKGEGKQRAAGGKGGGKGRGKAKGKGKGKGLSIPVGCESRTEDGRFICYGYQSGTCANAAAGGSCNRGYHICGKKNCHQNHPLSACTTI